MKLKLVFILAMMSMAQFAWAIAPVPVGTYEIDEDHSKIGFEIPHLVISTVEGRFDKFSGSLLITEKAEGSQMSAQIETASIDTNNGKRDDHLRSPDFFDVTKFPTMTFKSRKVIWTDVNLTIFGDLTIHGITKPVTVTGKFLGAVRDAYGNQRIVAQATTKIKRKDFHLAWNKMVEAGPIVGDEVSITLKIEAIKQTAPKK